MSLRLFAAIDIPAEVRLRLAALQRGVGGATWRPAENMHVTLRFFGEIAEPVAEDLDTELAAVAEATAPFPLSLKGAGSFGGPRPHTLWIGVEESAALRQLAAGCERAARHAGLKPETRKFAPHVTLASLANAALERVQGFEQRLGLFASEAWEVEGFALYSSQIRRNAPPLYRAEADYRFSRRAP